MPERVWKYPSLRSRGVLMSNVILGKHRDNFNAFKESFQIQDRAKCNRHWTAR